MSDVVPWSPVWYRLSYPEVLFRQIIVKDEQIGPVVDRRAAVRGDNAAAEPAALLVGIGLQQHKSRAATPCLVDKREHLLFGQAPADDAEVDPVRFMAKVW